MGVETKPRYRPKRDRCGGDRPARQRGRLHLDVD
jgi:hypothetical protein